MKKQQIFLGKLDHAEDERAAHEHVTDRKGIGNYDGDLRCATSHEHPCIVWLKDPLLKNILLCVCKFLTCGLFLIMEGVYR